MNEEDWDVILNALDRYMKCYDIINGKKEDFWRDKNAIEKLHRYLHVGLG
jgi:hypothetical protein